MQSIDLFRVVINATSREVISMRHFLKVISLHLVCSKYSDTSFS